MWFDRADGDIFAVLGRIAAVERRAAVDDVVSALPRPRPLLAVGDRNASPKYATATIDLTRTGHAGQPLGLLSGEAGIGKSRILAAALLCAANALKESKK